MDLPAERLGSQPHDGPIVRGVATDIKPEPRKRSAFSRQRASSRHPSPHDWRLATGDWRLATGG
ncbi:hypothetical protein CKO17_06615 [Marichromatium gracile]|nr:hypothetical protein [Marichromatium gracile]